ncbi:MAG: hypothetical protein QOI66_4604 [Myxococcales bacterium]|nr:hypothetical protein [Myxococcales bacterium]
MTKLIVCAIAVVVLSISTISGTAYAQAPTPPPPGGPSQDPLSTERAKLEADKAAAKLEATKAAVRQEAYKAAVERTGLMADANANPRNLYDRAHNVAVVLYDETGRSYGVIPQVDEDDTIAIAVVPTDPNKPVSDLRVTKCARGSEVRVGGGRSGGVPRFGPAETPPSKSHLEAAADHCGSEQGFEATFQDNAGRTVTVSISTLPLNRFTVGLGIFFDMVTTSSFAARSVKGQIAPVIVEDRHLGGLSTAAFVALRLEKVDTVRARNTFFQIFSPAAGVSLTAPTDHLYLALNVEPLPGFAILIGYQAFREQRLVDGYMVGDALQAGSPPTDKKWVWYGDSWWRFPLFLGLNLDSSLLKNILGAINK